jgi:hypothetical protein
MVILHALGITKMNDVTEPAVNITAQDYHPDVDGPSGSETVCYLLEDLTGQPPPSLAQAISACPSFPPGGMGHSQLNELLLLLGYDRVAASFFQFLVDGSLEYQLGSSIGTIDDLRTGIERARQLFLLVHGNVKFGFKKMASDAAELSYYFDAWTQPADLNVYKLRHRPTYPIDPIPPDETYYLGYVIKEELDARLEADPSDVVAIAQRAELERVREKGLRNHHAYLASDHLDIYVATSMRKRHEFLEIAEFTTRVFDNPKLQDLKLRWFDPTQAYCGERIDKGLSEALMLKRAACTLYLGQESDTLGKNSELASTLAQGKPVIAYLPCPTDQEVKDNVSRLATIYERSEEETVLERLQVFSPDLAWCDPDVRGWLDCPGTLDRERAMQLLTDKTRGHYDRRAKMLKETHPLGIQVNLGTGVANGVLVVRTPEDCSELIYRIISGTLQFRIEEKMIEGSKHLFLRETLTDSIFRVMTGDAMLTNSFWNFYLEPNEN